MTRDRGVEQAFLGLPQTSPLFQPLVAEHCSCQQDYSVQHGVLYLHEPLHHLNYSTGRMEGSALFANFCLFAATESVIMWGIL